METRERSPNYPAFGLEETIDLVEKFYAAAGRTAVSDEAAAIALGYGGLNGRSRSKIAAMRHYGLIEDAGQGKVRVADRAVDLIHKADDSQYMRALRDSALTPPLFNELWAKYPSANDAILKNHLIKDRKFSQDGAERVLQSFRKTSQFARLGEVVQPASQDTEGTGVELSVKPDSGGKDAAAQERPKPQVPGGGFVAFNFLLSGGVNANVAFSPKPTPRAIERLIEYLQLMRDDLRDESQASEPERTEGAQ